MYLDLFENTDGQRQRLPTVLARDRRLGIVFDRIQECLDFSSKGLDIIDLKSIDRNACKRVGGIRI